MKAQKLTDKIYWIGAIDREIRSFHGYLTERGSTYNAYLIIDEKITLVDTVKNHFYEEMLDRIKDIIDPSEIDYIISNHVEMDHSGSLPEIIQITKNATLFTSPKGKEGLTHHYNTEKWNIKTVNPSTSINLGEKSLKFILTPMVHWPDNMLTYIPESKILLSNDAFGQHYATPERFDDQVPFDILMEEAKKYYANIVMPYSNQVQRVLKTVENMELDIKMIAPSHGIIWRNNITKIFNNYQKWANDKTEKEALIVYDSMWGSTKEIASAIQEMFTSQGIKTRVKNLEVNHISNIIPYILDASYVCVGSPTLNNNMLPSVASFLTYLKGLSAGERKAIAFGSYGWSGQSIGLMADMLEETGYELLDQVKVKYRPDRDNLNKKLNKLKEEI